MSSHGGCSLQLYINDDTYSYKAESLARIKISQKWFDCFVLYEEKQKKKTRQLKELFVCQDDGNQSGHDCDR
jgi:hypothetical protein